jgi:hypothetical protein
MMRSGLALFGGFMAGLWLITGITKLGQVIYPPPAWLDFEKRETILEAIRTTPTGMLAILLVAYAFGTFVSAGIAARIAPTSKIVHGLIVGGLLLFLCLGQLMNLPYPVWFKVSGVAVFPPAAFLGARLMTLAPTSKPPGFEE